MGQRVTLAADIYALGVLLAELLTRTLVTRRGMCRLPRAPDECPADVAALIQDCLAGDPAERPCAAEVLARLRAAA